MAKGYKDYLNNFETEHIKGFQFGNPEYSKEVYLDFFDIKDKQYSIIFTGKFTQGFIDYVLKNIKTNHKFEVSKNNR